MSMMNVLSTALIALILGAGVALYAGLHFTASAPASLPIIEVTATPWPNAAL